MQQLRLFDETHIHEDCSTMTGMHNNGLFYDCEFKQLRGLSLLNCALNGSRFTTDSIKDALDFSLTLNCFSFENVEYSELLFDLLITLCSMSKGNDEKRSKLAGVIGEGRLHAIQCVLKGVEF